MSVWQQAKEEAGAVSSKTGDDLLEEFLEIANRRIKTFEELRRRSLIYRTILDRVDPVIIEEIETTPVKGPVEPSYTIHFRDSRSVLSGDYGIGKTMFINALFTSEQDAMEFVSHPFHQAVVRISKQRAEETSFMSKEKNWIYQEKIKFS